MRRLPTKASESVQPFTVADFLEAGREKLQLSLVAGAANLERAIEEPVVNRPGLALTGFFDHFAWGRPQLMGNAEMAYLRSLKPAEGLARFRALLDRKAFFFVCTCGRRPSKAAIRLADERGAVILTTPLATCDFAHHCAFVMERLTEPSTSIYGTMVEVCGLGVLFEGDPGLGKSETALGLIKRGSALIADDLTCVRRDLGSNLLFGSASESTAGYMEIRGIGIMHIPSLFGVTAVRGEKRLELVITFRLLDKVRGEIDRVGGTRRFKRILGVDVPNVIIPVSEGRDLVNLVETAAMQQKLLMAGGDPVADLSERLRRRADAAASAGDKGRDKANG